MAAILCPHCFTPYFVKDCPVCHGNEDFAAGRLDCWKEIVEADDDAIQRLQNLWSERRTLRNAY